MHICFLSLDYPSAAGGGGVGTQTQTVGQALVRRGHQVTVIALAQAGQPEFEDDLGVKVYRVPLGSLHWYAHKIPVLGRWLTLAVRELEVGWAVYRQARRLHAQHPFDLIEGIEWGAFWTAILFKEVPLIIRLHGEQYTFHKYTPDLPLTVNIKLSRVLQRMAMRRARLLTSPSQAHANEITAELGRNRPPVEVIPNAVNLHREAAPQQQRMKIVGQVANLSKHHQQVATCRRYGNRYFQGSRRTVPKGRQRGMKIWPSPPNPLSQSGRGGVVPATGERANTHYFQRRCDNSQESKTVLFVGRLDRVKGVPILLQAAKQVTQQMPDVRFVLIGGHHPNFSPVELAQLSRRLGLNGQVQLLGHIPRPKLEQWYRQADVCVLPSYYETFGLAALESMACGVPVVASNVGGLAEVIDDGLTGVLVSPGEGQALATAIIKLLQDQNLQGHLSQAGQQRAGNLFNLEAVVETTLAVYTVVAKDKSK